MSILRVWEHALCLVVAVKGVPGKQCWTERRDYHGPDGTPRKLNWLHECQSACINDSRCEAIDWEPNNVGKTCWILTSTAIKETTKHGVITNYQLDRTCLGESCFYDQPSAFWLCHVAYSSETVIICHFIQITSNDFYRASGILRFDGNFHKNLVNPWEHSHKPYIARNWVPVEDFMISVAENIGLPQLFTKSMQKIVDVPGQNRV